MSMKNVTILPADTYMVVNKTTICEEDNKLISMLYQPIIGHTAVSLYFTLIDDLNKSKLMSNEVTHHHLMSTMQLSLNDIAIARTKLEAVGLIKTYLKQDNINHFVYLIYSPISANEFFHHPILNIVLYNNLGKKEYDKVLAYYKIPEISLRDYEDITSSFDEIFSSCKGNPIEVSELSTKTTNDLKFMKSIDFDELISSIPKDMLNAKCFTPDTKDLINAMSFVYNLDTSILTGIVRDSLNEKGLLDKDLFRKACRNYYQFDNAGALPSLIYNVQPDYLKKATGDTSKWAKMVYTFENITPYQLLKAKMKGAEPTDHDKKIVESLLVDQKLKPGVVNVLISYVLQVNNEELRKNYVETIAGQWKRLNIETVEEAMKLTEKEHKKLRKIISKDKYVPKKTSSNEPVPAWFDKDNNTEPVTGEESVELTKILDELV